MILKSKQFTVEKPIKVAGIGLHTGKKVEITFGPASTNSGFFFRRIDMSGKPTISARLEHVVKTNRGTVLCEGDATVNTVEHILAALNGLGFTNVQIDINNEEPPACDGSSLLFVKALQEAGKVEQPGEKVDCSVKEVFWIRDGQKSMAYLPSDKFEVTFTLDYDNGILPSKTVHIVINEDEFKNRIARARTFGFEYEFEMLEKSKLALGGSLENAILIQNNGEIKNPEGLRDENELIYHKILDLIGDFSLIGRKVRGHIIANRTGHSINVKFADLLNKKFLKSQSKRDHTMMYIEEIKQILPHRYPFLLVDRILSVDPGKSIVGIKNVTSNEEFFNGHFPQKPVMPGVLIVEAMAQVAGVLFLSEEEHKGKTPFFCGIDKVRFRRPVVPGDRLEFHAKVLRVRRNTGKVEVSAKVDGETAASGELMFQIV